MVIDAVERRGATFGRPAEVFEKTDVRELHMRDHLHSAEPARGRHREPHELGAEVVGAKLWEHRQAVSLPLTPAALERVQPHRSAWIPLDQAKCVERRVAIVALVVIIVGEQRLLGYEHRTPELKMGLKLVIGRRQTALNRGRITRSVSGARPGHVPPLA